MTGTARALFVKHPGAQSEWCSKNLSKALMPRVLHKQRPSKPIIITIITRNLSRPSCSWKSIELCHLWYYIRGINWPAGFDICAFNPCVPHSLCLVPMSCCKWRLVWSVNFSLHAQPAKLWRHNNLIYAHHLTIMLVSTPFHCSKRGVAMVRRSQVALHTRVLIPTETMCDEILST